MSTKHHKICVECGDNFYNPYPVKTCSFCLAAEIRARHPRRNGPYDVARKVTMLTPKERRAQHLEKGRAYEAKKRAARQQ